MRKLLLFAACAALLMTTIWGCDEENTTPSISGVTLLSFPSALLADHDSSYYYAIHLTGMEADSIFCDVFAPDSTPLAGFALLDDGNSTLLSDPPYASPTSGDIAAHNGTFTRSINGRLLADGVTGNYNFVFSIMQNGIGLSNFAMPVRIENVQPCRILSWPPITDFPECSDPITMEILMFRDPVDHVDSVQVELLQTGVSNPFRGVLNFEPITVDTTWRAVFDPTMFSCAASTPLANYQLTYTAKTRFGMSAIQTVEITSFTNHLPVLSNSLLPDTVYRPVSPTQTDTIPITVDLNDCELAGEIYYYGVHFDRARDNMSNWSSDPLYYLRDDGLAGDVTAGDGRFTVALTIIRADTLPDNMYYFRFYAVECAPPNDTSAYMLDSMRVIQQFGEAAAHGSGTGFGMGFVSEGIRR
jgi:hypothetical protein